MYLNIVRFLDEIRIYIDIFYESSRQATQIVLNNTLYALNIDIHQYNNI